LAVTKGLGAIASDGGPLGVREGDREGGEEPAHFLPDQEGGYEIEIVQVGYGGHIQYTDRCPCQDPAPMDLQAMLVGADMGDGKRYIDGPKGGMEKDLPIFM